VGGELHNFLELRLEVLSSVLAKGQSLIKIRREVEHMRRGFALKAWVYFLCVSFLLLASGFHILVADAKEMSRPLGDMLSPGDAMFESTGGVWKNVEVSEFPIFPGVRIKTIESPSLVALQGDRQIDVGKYSVFSFDRNDQMQLIQGSIEFRLPVTSELSFRVGELTVIPSTSLQASRNPLPVSPKGDATTGSILVHSNGAVTIKSTQGSLSVLNQERVVLAALSPQDTVTIPSVAVKSPNVMVAQGDEKAREDDDEGKRFLGIPWWIWEVTLAGGVMATIFTFGITSGGGHGGGGAPVCP
jgi:hypothetical protein